MKTGIEASKCHSGKLGLQPSKGTISIPPHWSDVVMEE
jgi:hypothetical protein